MQVLDLDNPKTTDNCNTQIIDIFPPEFFNSLKIMDTFTKSMQESARLARESTIISISQSFKEVNENIIKTISLSFKGLHIFPIAEADTVLEEESRLIPASAGSLAIVQSFEEFKIRISIEGRFYYEQRKLERLTAGSKHGKFFQMLLESDYNYVKDDTALYKLNPSDREKGLGYIRDDLVKALGADKLAINLARNRKNGYRLVSVKPQTN